jgi:hypothetical protein
MALFGKETEEDARRAQEWTQWAQERNPLALVSMVLGVFSVIELGAIPIFSLAGFIVGIGALRQLKRGTSPQRLGHRLAWAGVSLSGVALVIGASLYLRSYWILR